MSAATANQFYAELAKIIDIPPRCTSIDIRIRVGKAVELECTCFPEFKPEATFTKRYRLEEIPAPPVEGGTG